MQQSGRQKWGRQHFQAGRVLGDGVGRGGILNVRPCHIGIWGLILIFMVAGKI